MSLSINPMKQTSALGTFGVESTGFIAGTAQDDPALRFKLAGGILDAAETLPMFGGIAISEYVAGAANGPRRELGPIIKRATQISSGTPTTGDLTGFAVFDQQHAMVMSAESAVPQAAAGMSVHFYRLGSGARLALPIAPALAGSAVSGLTTQKVAWDFAYQRIVPQETAGAAANISAATWSSSNGGRATFTVSSDLSSRLSVGAPVLVAGVTPSGYNGTWTIVSINATTIVVTMAVDPGAYSSGGTADEVTTATAVLPVRILETNVGGSMVPVYDPVTGFVNWDRAGSAALVLI